MNTEVGNHKNHCIIGISCSDGLLTVVTLALATKGAASPLSFSVDGWKPPQLIQ